MRLAKAFKKGRMWRGLLQPQKCRKTMLREAPALPFQPLLMKYLSSFGLGALGGGDVAAQLSCQYRIGILGTGLHGKDPSMTMRYCLLFTWFHATQCMHH